MNGLLKRKFTKNASGVLPEDLLVELYVNQKMSMKAISESVGLSVGSVFNLCKKYGIESREAGFQKGHKVSREAAARGGLARKGIPLSEENKKNLSLAKFRGGVGCKKKRSDGYIAIRFPEHPRANKEGYVMEHDLVAECARGYALRPDEVVHHINGIKNDNRLCNLQIMTFKEHSGLHMRERWAKKRKEKHE